MKTVVSFFIALLFTVGFASAQSLTLSGAGLTLDGGSEDFSGSVMVNGSGTLQVGGATLVLSTGSNNTIVGDLTLYPSGNLESGSNQVLTGSLYLSGTTISLATDPGTLTLGTVYDVTLPTEYTFDSLTNGSVFTLQATPEPPTVLLLAVPLIAGALFRFFRPRSA